MSTLAPSWTRGLFTPGTEADIDQIIKRAAALRYPMPTSAATGGDPIAWQDAYNGVMFQRAQFSETVYSELNKMPTSGDRQARSARLIELVERICKP